LPEEWKESIIVQIYKKGDKANCSNYRGTSRLSNTYIILSSILLSRLTPYAEEIIGCHKCGFRRNRPTTDQYSAFVKYLRKNWEYTEAVLKLFIDFKNACDSFRRHVLCNILIESGTPMEMVKLKKCV
jgi:hypothetical protein